MHGTGTACLGAVVKSSRALTNSTCWLHRRQAQSCARTQNTQVRTLHKSQTERTSSDAVMHYVQAMHSNLLCSCLDVLQLILCLDSHILDLAHWLINVRDLSLLCCFDTLRSDLCKHKWLHTDSQKICHIALLTLDELSNCATRPQGGSTICDHATIVHTQNPQDTLCAQSCVEKLQNP